MSLSAARKTPTNPQRSGQQLTREATRGQQEAAAKTELPAYDPACYLCPGNKRAGGELANPPYESTFAFVNDYSAVKESQAEYRPSSDTADDAAAELLRVEPVTGKCFVLTFSAAHYLTLADLPPAAILPVIHAWTQIYARHLSPSSPLARMQPPLPAEGASTSLQLDAPRAQCRYMQIFENKGAAMGCSNPHPHGQVWTTTGLPEEPALELAQLVRYRTEHGGAHLLEAYAALEAAKGERVVFANASFLALCPWWGTWPFEIMVVSRARLRALVDFGKREQADLAEALAEVTRRYDNLFETHFPYSMGLHQAPLEGSEEEIEASHFHIHFYPPLLRSATVRKFLVGYEIDSGRRHRMLILDRYEMMAEPQRDITPEQAAERLRNCGGPLYRGKMAEQNA